MRKVKSALEKRIDKIQKQLWEECNGSENDNWKTKFIAQLDNIKIKIHQSEVNLTYILNKGDGVKIDG